MASVAHHDQSRSKVSQTAFGVAKFRAMETAKGEGALIHDRFAALFQTPESDIWIKSLDLSGSKLDQMVYGIGVRTLRIDQEISSGLRSGITQVVVLGAGLDCRPWRIHENEDMNGVDCSRVKWFEIDFAEVFEYKLDILEKANAQTPFQYVTASANIAVDNMMEKLKQSGYESSSPVIWVLEGFTGYLTEEELSETMKNLTLNSSKGSKLIATFLGKGYVITTSMHRFRTDTPLEFLAQWAWGHGQKEVLSETCKALGRPSFEWDSYFLVTAFLL
eukprot:Colp12_sorted_trinity150504_noHs@33710